MDKHKLKTCGSEIPETQESAGFTLLLLAVPRKLTKKHECQDRDQVGCWQSLPEDQNPGIQGSLAVCVARQPSNLITNFTFPEEATLVADLSANSRQAGMILQLWEKSAHADQ